MSARSAGYCRACDHRMESPAHQQRCVDLPARVLADVLDLVRLAEQRQPAHRYVSTARLREVIGEVSA